MPKSRPEILIRLMRPKPTIVYNTYWQFACKRQKVFHAKTKGDIPPWTEDSIINKYKFTNVYRASDRTSQYLIKNVIYSGSQNPQDQFFRIMLFKLFNKIETWELLERELGEISWEGYDFQRYDKVLNSAFEQKERIYSAAYIVPSPQLFGYKRKHRNHLRLIEQMLHANVPQRLQELNLMKDAFLLLSSFPSIGNFLAFQFTIDLNYSSLTNYSEMDFVVPGPGALDGIRKCFSDLGDLNETDVIRFMTDRQAEEYENLELDFEDLWGRPLQLIDCQNLFCEVDKYSRIAHPEIKGISGRQRIKQVYRSSSNKANVWYPPKWGINHRIDKVVN